MAERAHVSSVDALEAFRAQLVLYIGKARPTLEEVSADVTRTRLWLENEKRVYWENQLRKRKRDWDEAQAALFSSRLSNLRDETAAEVQAVHRCRRAYEEAEEKLKILRRWLRDFESRVQPLVKQMEKLHTILANDLPKAVTYLSEAVRALDAYAGVKPPAPAELSPPPAPAPDPSPMAPTEPAVPPKTSL